jgi:hypothetical protein
MTIDFDDVVLLVFIVTIAQKNSGLQNKNNNSYVGIYD